MKKNVLQYVLGLLLLCTPLQSMEVSTEARVGYFFPTGDVFREIHSGGPIVGLDVSTPLMECLDVWASINYFSRDGETRSSLNDDSTHNHVSLVPIVIGLKYVYSYNCFDFYAGGGIQYTHFHATDDSPFLIQDVSKWGVGEVARAGAIYYFDSNFFVDLFVDYSFLKVDFRESSLNQVLRHRVDLSGCTVGLGIGYTFGCD